MVHRLHFQQAMKKPFTNTLGKWVLPLAVLAAGGCSTIQGGKSGQEIAAKGPTILDAKSEPSTVELDTNLRPTTARAEIFADVKDFSAPITSVKARFVHVPIELPMEKLAGTTWHASLSPQQLKQLAVSGQTMKYDVNIIATNQKGESATSQQPVQVAVKTPEAKQLTG